MIRDLGYLAGEVWLIIVPLASLWLAAMALFTPVWMLLLLARLSRIARALEGPGGDRAVVAERSDEQMPALARATREPSLGHQLLR
jgi:hypothetical protein